jgi:hypothetical protein
MTRGQLITLAIAAFIMTALAITTPWQRDVEESVTRGLLYPELASRLNGIARVTVHSAGEKPVVLERQSNGWVVSNRGGYPADVGPLREGLLALSRAELLQAMTDDPERYAALSVQAAEQPGAEGQEVILQDADGAELAHVIVGETSDRGGSYVRRGNEARSWLVSEQIDFPDSAADWLVKDLVDIAADRLRRIEMRPAKGPGYTLVKPDPQDTEFQMQDAPKGYEALILRIEDISRALEGLQLSDVRPEGEAPEGNASWHAGRFETADGLVIETQTLKSKGKHYLKLSASVEPAAVQDVEASGQEETQKTTEDAQVETTSPKDVKIEAQQLNQRFKGWAFVIPEEDADALSMSRKDLLQKKSSES